MYILIYARIVVIMGPRDPWLVSSDAFEDVSSMPMISIANAHNHHFWALHAAAEDDVMQSGDLAQSALEKGDAAFDGL